MKGQVSVETVMIIALILMIFIPILLLLYVASGGAYSTANTMEVNAALSQLASSSSIINSGAEPSAIFAKVYIPPSVRNISAAQLCNETSCITEFIANMNDGTQFVIVGSGKAEIDGGSLASGTYYLRIEAANGGEEKVALIRKEG